MEKIYPKHIYEPIRQEIATTYMQYEMRKLFRHVPEKTWEMID